MSFFDEIKRRKVFQVAAVYAVVAWLIIQIVDVVSEPLLLPDWFPRAVIVLLGVGLPLALILSWAFEVTPSGVVRDLGDDATVRPRGRRLEYSLIGLLAFAVIFMFVDSYVLEESLDDRRSVAVLPFTNASAAEENAEFFADGLHELTINRLLDIRSLRVIPRTSVMTYRGRSVDLSEVGAELGVATILTASVRRAGDTVQVTAQLIDAETDEHLWAETVDINGTLLQQPRGEIETFRAASAARRAAVVRVLWELAENPWGFAKKRLGIFFCQACG